MTRVKGIELSNRFLVNANKIATRGSIGCRPAHRRSLVRLHFSAASREATSQFNGTSRLHDVDRRLMNTVPSRVDFPDIMAEVKEIFKWPELKDGFSMAMVKGRLYEALTGLEARGRRIGRDDGFQGAVADVI